MCERHRTRYSHMRKIVNEGLSSICSAECQTCDWSSGHPRKCRDIGRVVLTSSAKMASGSGLQRTR
ncbi:hypothetical protein Bca4012_076145 [Brassica carinata]